MLAAQSQGKRVFVSGLGPVTCLGLGMQELAQRISALSAVHGAQVYGPRRGRRQGLVPDFALDRFSDNWRPYLDPQSRCALAAGALALESAAVQHDEVDPERCGLSLATMLGNLETQVLQRSMVSQKGMRRASPALSSQSSPAWTNSILSIEFLLRGYTRSFSGDLLSGAQALECALLALRSGRADLMLAGGADVVGPDLLKGLRKRAPADAPAPSQAAALLVLETERGLERREGYAFCELGSVVCRETRGKRSADDLAEALRAAVGEAMDEAGIWEGDVGVVFVCSAASVHPAAAEAERKALDAFSQVPLTTTKEFVGETFAAGFPLECMAAADALDAGVAPSEVSFSGESKGVEFWVERRPDPLMGDAALVVGCTPNLVAAAVLRAV